MRLPRFFASGDITYGGAGLALGARPSNDRNGLLLGACSDFSDTLLATCVVRLVVVAAVAMLLLRGGASFPVVRAQTNSLLLQQSNLTYLGAFRVPLADWGVATFAYGGTSLGFNPAHGSLYLVGHDVYQQVAEISVPAINTGPVSTLATATLLQPLTDVTEGRLPQINPTDPNAKKIGALLPYQGQLYVTGWSYYDGAGTQILSHFRSGQTLSVTGDVSGPWQVGGSVQGHNPAGFVSGYMGLVPQVWQAAFGGPVVTGQCCIGILGRTSSGPALFAIDPTLIGQQVPVPASPLVYYDILHQTLGGQYGQGTLFNGDVEVKGVVFPDNTDSVLFFGRRGVNYCYGAGTSDPSLAGQPVPGQPGVIYCYDPEDSSKGSHSYPKSYFVWAYNANDLAAVKAGQRLPWSVVPYATWSMTLPYPAWATHLNGAAYDPATQRVYLAQSFADGPKPVIHVFQLSVNPAPRAATSVRIS